MIGLPVRNPLLLNVHTPMSTLLEVDNRTGRIDQGAAVPASLIRQLAPTAELRRVFVDPTSHIPLGIDPQIHRTPRTEQTAPATPDLHERLAPLLDPFQLIEQAQPQHDPSRRLRQLIELRDQTCTGIGCSHPASGCHLDHEQPHPHGPTAAWNLSAKSARCHRAKHHGWTTTRHGPLGGPNGQPPGSTTWTSPLGHHYTRLSPWTRPPHRPQPHQTRPPTDLIIEIDYQHAA